MRAYRWLTRLGQAPEDSPSVRLAKWSMVRTAVLSIVGAAAFGAAFGAAGAREPAALGGILALAHFVNLTAFALRRGLRPFAYGAELIGAISFPVIRYSLRGMSDGGVIMIVGLLVVVGVAMSGRTRRAIAVTALYAGIVVLTEVAVHLAPRPVLQVSQWVRASFFAFTVMVTTAILVAMVLPLAAARRRLAAELKTEHERSEALLLNVLPGSIAARLKTEHATIANRHDEVTVLFADIVGFTTLSARLEPEEIVQLLDEIFSAFDGIAGELGLEKIKTIGDAYMVVGGLPEPRADHASAVAEMALRMRAAITEGRFGHELQLRIGLHTGPVVAGVIGRKKFSYDLWGDTVNTASRMESHGVPGEIQVSDAAGRALEAEFVLADRGEIDIKGRGRMRTFFLRGRRPEQQIRAS